MAEPSQDVEKGSRRESGALSASTTKQPSDPEESSLPEVDDWTGRLDANYTIEVLEYRSGSSEWQTVPIADIDDPSLLPDSVLIRLFLVEGLAKETITYFSGISKDFFRFHSRNVLPYDRLGFDSDLFFGKWSRRAVQNHEQWHIEDCIAKGRPFNLDMITDPRKVGLNHDRYERANGIHRPYSSLEANAYSGKQYARQAVEECISTSYTKVRNGFIGVLMFDAPRKVRVTRKVYKRLEEDLSASRESLQDSFSDFMPSRQRFREQIEFPANFEALIQSPEQSIRDIVLRFMLDDHIAIMSDFREALDFIDEQMSDDDVLRNCLRDWRYLFGQWKRNLANEISSITYVTQAVVYQRKLNPEDQSAEDPATKEIGRTNSALHPPIQAEFDRLIKEMQYLTERAGSTFQSIMSTMSILESAKAIAQAEEISKLTKLAFFFIPLTLCASVFGMNITEWDHHLKTWNWIVVSLLVTFFTYLALYSREMIIALSRSPTHLQALTVNSAARNINRSNLLFIYYSKRVGKGIIATLQFFLTGEGLSILGLIIFIVGWSLGIWAIATKTPLDYGVRVAIGIGFAIGLPAIILMWASMRDDDGFSNLTKRGFTLLAFLCVCIGVGIWALFRYAQIPHGEKITIAVGIGVGVPCLYTLWILFLRDAIVHQVVRAIFITAILLAALAPILWAIITQSSLDPDVKVSVSVGLGFGLPCLVPVGYMGAEVYLLN